MFVYPICSSSKGNCTYISNGKTGLLIDAGFGIRNLCKYLNRVNFSKDSIKAIFITHEHSDHISGLYSLTRYLSVPIFASKGTAHYLLRKNKIYSESKVCEVVAGSSIYLDDFEVCAFPTPHDCEESVGFCISCNDKKFSICTDVGNITSIIKKKLVGSNLVLLESNYDCNMLEISSYPYYIKKRIMSNFGHLSNDSAAKFIQYLIDNGANNFLLGHLSQTNNTPDLAFQTTVSFLVQNNIKINRDYVLNVVPVRNDNIVYEV